MRHSPLAPARLALHAGAPLAAVTRAQTAPAPSTTIILVRHAEKAAEPVTDLPLTPAGAARADALTRMRCNAR